MVAKDSTTYLERLMIIGNTLFHQALAVVTVYILWIIYFNYKPSEKFTWHMGLTTLAYIPLMAEGIVLFASENVWTRNIDRTTRYWYHGIIAFISAVLLTVGIVFEYLAKTGTHFKSKHGWTGFVSWVFVLLSQLLGLAATKPQIFGKVIRPVYIKFAHNLLGVLGYVFGIVSLAYGIEIIKRLTSDDARLATYWVMGISVLWSILAAGKSGYNQLKTIFT